MNDSGPAPQLAAKASSGCVYQSRKNSFRDRVAMTNLKVCVCVCVCVGGGGGGGGGCVMSSWIINPRRACAARVAVLSLSVCECVCYLANSYAVNAQVQSKIRIECKCATKGF